jgi:hypothetical protein
MGTRYGDGKHTQESLWLKSYTGEPTVIFRKSGKPVHLVAPCLSVLFVATPDKAQELFRTPRLTSGGLLPRFLVCDPKARPIPLRAGDDVMHRLPTDVSQPYEAAIFAALSRYCSTAAENSDEIDMVPSARSLVIEDWNRFCTKTNGTEDCPFEARHTENAIRIGLVLHTFRYVNIEQRSEGTFGAQIRRTITVLMKRVCVTRCESGTGLIAIKKHCGRHSERRPTIMLGGKCTRCCEIARPRSESQRAIFTLVGAFAARRMKRSDYSGNGKPKDALKRLRLSIKELAGRPPLTDSRR